MRSDAKDRLNRLLALVPYLLAHPQVKKSDVCAFFGIDVKTLDADLDALWYCGLPPYDPLALIDVEREGEEITLSSADYFSRPLRLTPAEAEALASALAVLGEADPSLASVLEKVEKAIGVRRQERGPKILQPPVLESTLDRIAEGIRTSRAVQITYYSASRDETGTRRIRPHRLLNLEGNWYVLGHCEQAGEARLFRLDRVLSAQVTNETFDAPRQVPIEGYEAGKAYTAEKAGKRALVRFSERASRWAREAWPEHERKERGKGATFEIPYSHEPWMVRQLLPYGTEAKILAPSGLVQAMTSTLRELRGKYG